ncbi:MAG: hypothetical protein ACXWRA_10280 [Pseudobdellovibrionaceae bacterium]
MERNYGNVGVLDIRDTSENVFEDSFMIGNMRWVYVGSVMAIMGIGLIAYALRRTD